MSSFMKKITGFYAIVDASCVDIPNIEETCLKIINGGGKIIQLRAKDLKTRQFLDCAKALRELTLSRNATFIINDRVDIALMSQADGVHLGDKDLPPAAARKILGDNKIIGFSTHTIEEARLAEKLTKEGLIDYIGFGPIFPTNTKKDAREVVGIANLKKIKNSATIPVVAIGGITESTVKSVVQTGADSVAIISEILSSPDITAKVKSITNILDCTK